MSAELSVLTVTYNSAEILPTFLQSLDRHLPRAEVIVVDNGSTDATLAITATHARSRVVRTGGNVGFGSAVNAGAAAATGDLLLILNPDATIAAIDRAGLERLGTASCLGLLACAVRGPRGDHFLVEPVWGWRAELLWSLMRWFVVPREVSVARPPRLRRARESWAHGAALVVRRDEFLRIGGFDEEFFLYFEDFDLSRRYSAAGFKIGTTDAVVVHHEGQRSSPRHEERMIAFALFGLVEYVSKWEGTQAAVAAARETLALLDRVQRLGGLLGLLPLVGSRADRKRASASMVEGYLRSDAAQGGEGLKNRAARSAFARAYAGTR